MRPRHRSAILIAALLSPLAGCGSEPSPLSPIADQAPERHALAMREMGDQARRNREAEAAFYRRTTRSRPAPPEASADLNPTNIQETADIREKS